MLSSMLSEVTRARSIERPIGRSEDAPKGVQENTSRIACILCKTKPLLFFVRTSALRREDSTNPG